MGMTAGAQLSTFRGRMESEEEFRALCARLERLGCRAVQAQWHQPELTPDFLAETMKAHGLRCVSTQDAYDAVGLEEMRTVRLLTLSGGEYLCVSGVPERYCTPAGLEAFARALGRFCSRMQTVGLRVLFHPRAKELAQTEVLMRRLPKLELCLDVYHFLLAGQDPAAVLAQYPGRIPMLHCKDRAADGRLVPVGRGVTDWPPILRAAQQAGVRWALAEQETWEKDPVDCMAESLAYLTGQGLTL